MNKLKFLFEDSGTPWKKDSLLTHINFIEIANIKNVVSYSNVLGSSIVISEDFIEFNTQITFKSNHKKILETVRFPTRYVKFYDCKETYSDFSVSSPALTFCTVNFYISYDMELISLP